MISNVRVENLNILKGSFLCLFFGEGIGQAVELYRFYQQQIATCDTQIEQHLESLDSRVEELAELPPDRYGKKARKHHPSFNLRAHLYRISGVDFTQVEGLDVLTIQTILSEVGVDPSRFPTVKHFTSWMGICPDNRITGGKVKSSHTRRVKNRAADAFRLAAQGASHSKEPLGAFYRRMRARLGAPKAITATAHKLARIFYRLWSQPDAYDPGRIELYEQKNTQRTIHYLKKKAHTLGFELVDCQR